MQIALLYVVNNIVGFNQTKFQTCMAKTIFCTEILVKNERLHTGRLHTGHFFLRIQVHFATSIFILNEVNYFHSINEVLRL